MSLPWTLPTPSATAVADLCDALSISEVLARVLSARGFADRAAAHAFLNPRLTELEEPSALADSDRAARRIVAAIRNQERIVVFGDYDVDGIVGTVILARFLRLTGARFETYIPNRLKEGHSLGPTAVAAFLASADPPGLIITVDHGVSAGEAMTRLKAGGIDVVVTDHHEPPPELPSDAYAIVNPRRRDCPSRFKELCGAGVAFKVAWAASQSLCQATKVSPEYREFLHEAMGLVALATVTDVMPLHGENRILTRFGLKALEGTQNPGLLALLRRANLQGRPLRASHCGYRLGPRVNAAGRMGISDVAVELLMTDDRPRATALAAQLEDANDARRKIEHAVLEEALTEPSVSARKREDGSGICVGRSGWHVGVLGIVASRLVDRFRVPALVAGFQDGIGRASARSVPGVHLRDVLAECSEHLEAFGGHAGAAGATIRESAFPAFRSAFATACARALARVEIRPRWIVDAEISLDDIRSTLIEEIDRLGPFGTGNPMPLFCTRHVRVVGQPLLASKKNDLVTFFAKGGQRAFPAQIPDGRRFLDRLRNAAAEFDICYHLKFDAISAPGDVRLEICDLRDAAPRSLASS